MKQDSLGTQPIPAYVQNIKVIKLTLAGQVELCAYPEAAIKYATESYKKAARKGDNPFKWFAGVCYNHCVKQKLPLDWKLRAQLFELLGITEDMPRYEIRAVEESAKATADTLSSDLRNVSKENTVTEEHFTFTDEELDKRSYPFTVAQGDRKRRSAYWMAVGKKFGPAPGYESFMPEFLKTDPNKAPKEEPMLVPRPPVRPPQITIEFLKEKLAKEYPDLLSSFDTLVKKNPSFIKNESYESNSWYSAQNDPQLEEIDGASPQYQEEVFF